MVPGTPDHESSLYTVVRTSAEQIGHCFSPSSRPSGSHTGVSKVRSKYRYHFALLARLQTKRMLLKNESFMNCYIILSSKVRIPHTYTQEAAAF